MFLQSRSYCEADPVLYRGCRLDLLFELKFVSSIEDKYRFLREPVKIGYDPKTFQTTSYFRDNIRLYTPDFLIRNKNNGKAMLIEIKPNFFKGLHSTGMCEQIMSNYIRQNNLDWCPRIVFSDEIILSIDLQKKLNMFRNHKDKFRQVLNFQRLDRRYNQSAMMYHSSVPFHPEETISKSSYANFVRFGMPVNL